MTTFPGIVTLDTNRVAVTVGLEPDKVTLLIGDEEIGEWAVTECAITDAGDGTWLIEAEEDALPFLPDDPGGFAQSLNGGHESAGAPATVPTPTRASDETTDEFTVTEGPRPRAITMAGLYALALLTGALGIWAMISLIL